MSSLQLYKYLIRESRKLPKGANQHYTFQIKQSFKQYASETDKERISQIISRALEDAEWVKEKVRFYFSNLKNRNLQCANVCFSVFSRKVKISKMFRVPLATSDSQYTDSQFWNAVFLYHDNPHCVNRRIMGISQLFILELDISDEIHHFWDIVTPHAVRYEINKLSELSRDTVEETFVHNIFENHKRSASVLGKVGAEYVKAGAGVFISVRILWPRNSEVFQPSLEVAILDRNRNIASFLATQKTLDAPSLCPQFMYDVELDKSGVLKICVADIETAESKQSDWLADILFLKLVKWSESEIHDPRKLSLSLISIENYYVLYNELKRKYSSSIKSNWTESTDPSKYIHEDIATATYLILIWKQYGGSNKPSFVDLGCGNGLLVYILSQEGYTGFGIDVRKRKIWDTYPPTTKLEVRGLVPSNSLFPNTDWIIGNHSDELTPWIPVIAARSSKTCRFFLLPCCCYEFSGAKYRRKNSSQSQYADYIQYIKQLSESCGFKIEIDKLRIPSTKRTGLISTERIRNVSDEDISKLINPECSNIFSSDNKEWIDSFKIRSNVETVRNCTKLDKNLIEEIVQTVVNELLSKSNYIITKDERLWNTGEPIPLPDLAKLIAVDKLKELKNECGGLQTLLRNNHSVFKVEKGLVQLRVPSSELNGKKVKSKHCWFKYNHPDGCYLSDELCTYKH